MERFCTNDEPQHLLKGSITVNLLKLLGIKFCIVHQKSDFLKLKRLLSFSLRKNNCCLFNQKGTFKPNSLLKEKELKNRVKF